MSDVMGGIIGISAGVVIIISVQAACYKFITWENYHKAVVISLSCFLVGILAAIFIVEITNKGG